ncbi:MAG: hypothetical protein IH856_13250 [Deltaproteobacteria bacterium]|nr:hypothetical protein [Deltaproteobacteria bacterium]
MKPILCQLCGSKEGVCVVDADHEVPLSLGVVGVNTSARTVDWSLIFRNEGDIGQNSPSVQFEARVTQDRLPALAAV